MAIVTRFAPSPTGALHLGHAFAALTAQALGEEFLVRIEDIDAIRCKPSYTDAIFDDLHWLGLTWPQPVLYQSSRTRAYQTALDTLTAQGLTYRCICTRTDIRAALSAPQGPDGPVYPGTCRDQDNQTGALRLNLAKAARSTDLAFIEGGKLHRFNPAQLAQTLGDIVLFRHDAGFAYHLAVVVDDANQGVTLVTRGQDLAQSTPLHVLLQRLLNLPTPAYHHHRLILDAKGKRLAKRDDARALAKFRAEGATPQDIRRMIGL